VPGKLGIHRFVTEITKIGRLRCSDEEIGVSSPAALKECRLVDNIDACPQGLGCSPYALRTREIIADLRDGFALLLEGLKVFSLMFEAFLLKKLVAFGSIVASYNLGKASEIENDRMVAAKEVDQVGGGKDVAPVVASLHLGVANFLGSWIGSESKSDVIGLR
jgi:hypothetical protein